MTAGPVTPLFLTKLRGRGPFEMHLLDEVTPVLTTIVDLIEQAPLGSPHQSVLRARVAQWIFPAQRTYTVS